MLKRKDIKERVSILPKADNNIPYLGSWGGPSWETSWNSIVFPDFCPYSINMLIGCFPGSKLRWAGADDGSGSGCKGYSNKIEETSFRLNTVSPASQVKKIRLTNSSSEFSEENVSSHLIPPCLPFSASLIRTFIALAAASCLASFLLPASAGGNRRPLITAWNLNLETENQRGKLRGKSVVFSEQASKTALGIQVRRNS